MCLIFFGCFVVLYCSYKEKLLKCVLYQKSRPVNNTYWKITLKVVQRRELGQVH